MYTGFESTLILVPCVVIYTGPLVQSGCIQILEVTGGPDSCGLILMCEKSSELGSWPEEWKWPQIVKIRGGSGGKQFGKALDRFHGIIKVIYCEVFRARSFTWEALDTLQDLSLVVCIHWNPRCDCSLHMQTHANMTKNSSVDAVARASNMSHYPGSEVGLDSPHCSIYPAIFSHTSMDKASASMSTRAAVTPQYRHTRGSSQLAGAQSIPHSCLFSHS